MVKKKDVIVANNAEDGLKNGEKAGRNEDGTFGIGNPGGTGRPRGSYTKSPLPYIEKETFKEIAKVLSEKALAGDLTVCMHLCPKPPSPPAEPIYCTDTFDIGPTETPDQMMKAVSRLREAYARGEVSKDFSTYMENSILATYKVYEASELMPTLKALQEYIKKARKK